MDRITAIKIFLEVAASGSFSATADKLELSRPMVSRHIALMESWLNARLLQRTTWQVTLTDAGEQAVKYCRQILELAEHAEQETGNQDTELRGTVRVGCGLSFGNTHLTAAISDFQRLHPKLHMRLHFSDETLNLVATRTDLAIRVTATPDPALYARKLAPCRSLLVATPDYLAQYGTPHTPDDLSRHRCLAHENVNRTVWKFGRNGIWQDIQPDCPLTVNEATTLLHAALAHNGIAMLPRYLLDAYLADGRLVPLLADWQLPEHSIYALYPSKDKLPQAVRALLDFLAERFAGRDW